MRTFKNKELCQEVLQRLANGWLLDIEWKDVYNDVINYNMNLDRSIRSVFNDPRRIGNQVNWAYREFSKTYHGVITHYNLTKRRERKRYTI